MRSSVPLPGNPWPHDMSITVEDQPKALIDLLWLREAWNLDPRGADLPPLLSVSTPPAHLLAGPQREKHERWQSAWPGIWAAALDHAGQVDTQALFAQLHRTPPGSAERRALLRELIGPDGRDSFGEEAFTEQYHAWIAAGFETRSRIPSRPVGEEPERVAVASLVSAWRAGLTTIITIPCGGTHTRRIGPHVLLVTAETRDDPRRYADALSRFG